MFGEDLMKSFTKTNDKNKELSSAHAAEKDLLKQLDKDLRESKKIIFTIKVILISLLHVCALFGLYKCFIGAKLGTIIWGK